MADISILNASRIALIARSEKIEQATQMGFIDRIIDYFKGNVKRDAIKALFDDIAVLKSSGIFDANKYGVEMDDDEPSIQIGFGINEHERLEKFLQLRELALPEYRDQFKFDIHENMNGHFGCQLSIGNVEIYRNNDISDFNDLQKLPDFLVQKLRMDIEDSARNEDPVAFLKTLNGIHAFINEQRTAQFGTNHISADDKQEFLYERMREIFNALPDDTKAMLFSKGTSGFGNRIRGILNFGGAVLDKASQRADVKTPDGPNQDSNIPPMLMVNGLTQSNFSNIPPDLYARLTEIITICTPKPDSEIKHAPFSDAQSDYRPLPDRDSAEPIPPLAVTKVTSHRELTESETRALNIIGIPESILTLL
ncbi:hypothetical protein [Bordetella muralis]|jgi:hypothetical protein|uniref:hypothetical protein n=1 Tax=Bordetella muralis TaxID=1649130 RepID=UPI0039F107BC